MRILALVVVFWSFVGGPALCRAGVLVECCKPGSWGHKKSHDTPNKCPNEGPSDSSNCCSRDQRDKYPEGDDCPDDVESRPDNTESSEPRDCDSCAESCNVVSPHSKQTDGDDFAVLRVAVIATTQASYNAFLLHQHRSHNLHSMQMGERVPIPSSDRPLLI